MLTNHKIFITAPPPPQVRQHAPDNHVLDLVVICTLSPLRMLLLHTALSLLGCVQPHIHLGLLYTTQTRATLGTVISRAPLNPTDLSSSTSSSMHIPPLSRSSPGSTHGSARTLGGKPGRSHAYGKKHHHGNHGNHPHSHLHLYHAGCDGHLGGPQSQP